jgi:hypothetical protein
VATARDDTTPDADETLLRLLAEAVIVGGHVSLTPSELFRRAKERDASTFDKFA